MVQRGARLPPERPIAPITGEEGCNAAASHRVYIGICVSCRCRRRLGELLYWLGLPKSSLKSGSGSEVEAKTNKGAVLLHVEGKSIGPVAVFIIEV